MAEYKQIKTRMWQDNWFLSLNANEKLVWIFILTNEYSHISGLYELPKTLISPLLGVNNWEKILLRFVKDKKINYKNGWIHILNKQKHQPVSKSAKDNINKSINRHLEENKNILASFKEKKKPLTSPLPDPCQTLPEVKVKVKDEYEGEVLQTDVCGKINPLINLFYEINPTINFGNKTQRKALEDFVEKFGYDKTEKMITYAMSVQGQKYSPVITTPLQLKNKLGELTVFYQKENNINNKSKSYDFTTKQ